MKILKTYPPNYQEIKRIINSPLNAIFSYGEIIYNPEGKEIPEDILYHEKVHLEQQKKFPGPDIWWTKWIWDKQFRQNQEVEAFALQVQWIKKHINDKAYKECLNECVENLSKNYKLDLSLSQAETMIRKFKK